MSHPARWLSGRMSVGVRSDPTEVKRDLKQRLGRGFAQGCPLGHHATLRCVFVKQRAGLFHNDSRCLQ
jgi:hypothetical protein